MNPEYKEHTNEEKKQQFDRLLNIMSRLRAECPWDKEQTFATIARHHQIVERHGRTGVQTSDLTGDGQFLNARGHQSVATRHRRHTRRQIWQTNKYCVSRRYF